MRRSDFEQEATEATEKGELNRDLRDLEIVAELPFQCLVKIVENLIHGRRVRSYAILREFRIEVKDHRRHDNPGVAVLGHFIVDPGQPIRIIDIEHVLIQRSPNPSVLAARHAA